MKLNRISGVKLIFCILLFVLSFFITGCSSEQPIKIGFSAGLTGRHADLGLYGRNGVLLAVEEINAAGGINGAPIELMIRDDQHDPEVARKVDQELIDSGVVAIVGHMTSAMSVAAAPVINKSDVLLFSPTTSTNKLTGQDDNFLRMIHANQKTISRLADYVMVEKKLSPLVVVYDQSNSAFSKEWADEFEKYAEELEISSISIPFLSSSNFNFNELAQNILSHQPEGVLIVAAALDAAMICQQLRKLDDAIPLFSTLWSMTSDFVQHGGQATEGVVFVNWFDPEHPAQESREFRKKYEERFARKPTFASHFAYEVVTILAEALHTTKDPQEIKRLILEKGEFQGTQGKLRLDKYGDAERELFLMIVSNGKFTQVK